MPDLDPDAARIRAHFLLEPDLAFLNHGSFGACPREVLAVQSELRARLERQPVRFFVRELPGLLDEARATLAGFVGADPDDLAFVPNATHGVATVLRSFPLRPGDELLRTSHGYNACNNALIAAAEAQGARVAVAELPFPVASAAQLVDAVLATVTPRTKLALLDAVTSPTGLVLPYERLVPALEARGIAVLLDAAHAPGMLALRLSALGASFTTGNCHKWICAPKGAAFLHVRRDRQAAVRPLAVSHGANAPLLGRSRFRAEFDWTGTADPTAALCVPAALRFVGGLVPGGWAEVRRRNREKVLRGRDVLCAALDVAKPAPDELIGSLAAVPLPDGVGPSPTSSLYADPLQEALVEEERIEVPIVPFPAWPRRLVRISGQLYVEPAWYERLAVALRRRAG